jgi:hypothetical protein
LILVLVECSLYIILDIVKAIEVAIEEERIKLNIIELLSLSSESDSKLYQAFSLSLVAILQANLSESEESGGEESSDWLSNKSGKSNKPLKIAIITSFTWESESKEESE